MENYSILFMLMAILNENRSFIEALSFYILSVMWFNTSKKAVHPKLRLNVFQGSKGSQFIIVLSRNFQKDKDIYQKKFQSGERLFYIFPVLSVFDGNNYSDMRFELSRLLTYEKVNGHELSFMKLSKQGLYFSTSTASLVCFHCHKKSSSSANEYGANLHTETCEFFHGGATANVTAEADESGYIFHTQLMLSIINSQPMAQNGEDLGHLRMNEEIQNDHQTNTFHGVPMRQARHGRFRIPSTRRTSFDHPNWPTFHEENAQQLADSGFFFNGTDKVHCFFCGVECIWRTIGKNPAKCHLQESPSCMYIRHKLGVPFKDSCYEEDTFHDISQGPLSIEHGSQTKRSRRSSLQIPRPNHQKYINRNNRMESFDEWPTSDVVEPDKLADAGFFYSGTGDSVQCFQCGGSLENWTSDDDPWVKHARCYPTCDFVRNQKGDNYIKLVKNTMSHDGRRRSDGSKASDNQGVKKGCRDGTNHGKDLRRQSLKRRSFAGDEDQDYMAASETKLMRKDTCVVCYDKEHTIVFLPCGHLVTCVDCAYAQEKCAVCRKAVTARLEQIFQEYLYTTINMQLKTIVG
ncbi:baculoviral IAP repeat-containing protein 3-like isoform X4 [Mya arenaria]|uniref:baculoviral IAP repeat-containing protein 3-like isoform X4 n=1 Tax=Mya arenaria TaxID=6604 RepID=UPI0022E29C40|nr:baculoviral IAP repeat-containing protein 3-like isoform X4 [Mya arenaria]